MVGEDGEEDGEHELDGGLGGWDDVDQLDGVLAGGLEPEREGLDAAGWLLRGFQSAMIVDGPWRRRALTALMKMMYRIVKR